MQPHTNKMVEKDVKRCQRPLNTSLTSCYTPPAAFAQMGIRSHGARKDNQRASHRLHPQRSDLSATTHKQSISNTTETDQNKTSSLTDFQKDWGHPRDSSIRPDTRACCQCSCAPGCRSPGSSWCIPGTAGQGGIASLRVTREQDWLILPTAVWKPRKDTILGRR